MKGISDNLPDLDEPCRIFLWTKATKIIRGLTIDVSKSTSGFMLQMDFSFLNVYIIRGFTSTFVAICSATSFAFGFPSRIRCLTIEILKLFVTILINQDKIVLFVWVDEDGALARYSEFTRTCHKMNSIVQTICGDASSLNGTRETSNKTLTYITRYLLLN